MKNYGIIMKLEFSRGGKTILTPLPLLPNFRRKEPTMSENQMKLIKDLGLKEYGTQGCKTRYGLFECPICKKHFEVITSSVRRGKTKKCGSCANRITSTTHGLIHHRIYNIWCGIKERVFNQNNPYFKNYGARGITICDEWKNDVKSFYNWAMENGYKENLTIDRIDNDGNYEPSNCRWATKETQQRNTRVLRKNNTTGYRGVCFSKQKNKFVSHITINYKLIHIGIFKTALEAAIAYDTYVINNNLEHTINGVKFDSRD